MNEKHMTVGVLAKRMNTTVRTLQYYDKEGVLSPSAQSEGGRRLYSDKDVVRLHQILSLKYLGFSLEEIKKNLTNLDTPQEVATALEQQMLQARARISELNETLTAIEKLHDEVLKMQMVDFSKYADIVVNLQMKNEFYGLIKHFDSKQLDDFRRRFDGDSAQKMIGKMKRLCTQAVSFHNEQIPPDSEQGLAFAKAWWDLVTEFTDGDFSLLPKLNNMSVIKDSLGEDWVAVQDYLEKALEAYFASLGINPFEGVQS